jgi:hypothetical protein
MVSLGVFITAATITVVVAEFFRQRRFPLPAHGWLGLLSLAGAEWLMFHGVEPVAMYFTPIAWTAYLLITDAAVLAITGHSRLHDAPRRFGGMALLSIPLWMLFEAYNLRLHNWIYIGLPMAWPAAIFGYAWSYATITPAILETADLIESLRWFPPARPVMLSSGAERAMMIAGALCLAVPLVLPRQTGAYLFGLVWIGFYLALDPANHRLGLPSLIGDFAQGRRGRSYSLLVSGWICGWLWEFWNYWAAAKWNYVFPIFQGWKIFEMPAPGYLGFLSFALECFVMYVTAAWLVGWLKRS